MLTKEQLARMRDHNGLPVVFSEYEERLLSESCTITRVEYDTRFIVKPEWIAGNIGSYGMVVGDRVVFQLDRYSVPRVSCRSRVKVGYGGDLFPGDPFVWLATGNLVKKER